MAAEQSPEELRDRVDVLAGEVDQLKRKLAALEARLGAEPAPRAVPVVAVEPAPAAVPGGPLGRLGAAFGRVAVASFLLVVALVLRTLTDSGVLGVPLGIGLGLAYTLGLSAAGWVLLRRRSAQAQTVCITSALLLVTLLLEGVFRHGVPSVPVAYGCLLMLVAGTGWALMGCEAAATLWVVGTLALAAGWGLLSAPAPYPWLVALCLVCNGMAGTKSQVPARVWYRLLSWGVLLVAGGAWGLALHAAAQTGEPIPAPLAGEWFGVGLLAAVGAFAVSAVREVTRDPSRWTGRLDAGLLPVTLGWGHVAAVWGAAGAVPGAAWLGGVELAAAGGLLVIAWGLQRRRPQGGPGAGLLSAAAAVPALLGAPAVLGAPLALVLWSTAAVGLARLAQGWHSGGTRVVSYVLPMAGCAYALFAVVPGSGGAWRVGLAAALGALAAGAQYRWQGAQKPPVRSWFFNTVDRRDDLAALLLFAAVGLAVVALRAGVHSLLWQTLAEPADTYACLRSALVNLAGLALVVRGQHRGDGRQQGAGVVVLVAGAALVFGLDLLTIRGLPLVGSVLSFGVAAGGAALALRRQGKVNEE